jgi:hypothetical protein
MCDKRDFDREKSQRTSSHVEDLAPARFELDLEALSL